MKRLLALCIISVSLLSACSTYVHIENKFSPYSELRVVDFRPYTAKGFLITPELYRGDYESIALIDFKIMPGAQFLSPNGKLVTKEPYYFDSDRWVLDEKITLGQALDSVYQNCIDMGADALMNFNIEHQIDDHGNIDNPIVLTGYRITGFAIKRK